MFPGARRLFRSLGFLFPLPSKQRRQKKRAVKIFCLDLTFQIFHPVWVAMGPTWPSTVNKFELEVAEPVLGVLGLVSGIRENMCVFPSQLFVDPFSI